jgi:hypothetical protein
MARKKTIKVKFEETIIKRGFAEKCSKSKIFLQNTRN